jgi:hypothetical protein
VPPARRVAVTHRSQTCPRIVGFTRPTQDLWHNFQSVPSPVTRRANMHARAGIRALTRPGSINRLRPLNPETRKKYDHVGHRANKDVAL